MGGVTSMPGGRLTWILCYKHDGGPLSILTDDNKMAFLKEIVR